MALLIDKFLQKMQNVASPLSRDPLVSSGLNALAQAVRKADVVYFSQSTMKMLWEKLDQFDEICDEVLARSSETSLQSTAECMVGAWIEFSESIAFPVPIAAMFAFVPSQYLDTGKDKNHLYLISKDADVYSLLSCAPGEAWQLDNAFHRCPTRQCTEEYGVTLLCETCNAILVGWSSIFTLSAIIANQYLAATRYEEREFTSVRRVPRKHGGKTKAIVSKRVFKVIDANEILIEVPATDEEESERTSESRDSWLLDALAQGNVEYRDVRTRPFVRQYRHPRYVNMQGKSTSFPDGVVRRQPVKKSLEGQRITKVVASEYEEGNNGS